MKIQPRDKHILDHLNRYGVLSTRQIRELFFKGKAHSTVMRRLRKLEKRNLIGRIQGLDEALLAWRLATQGAEMIGASSSFRYSNRNAIEHEVTLSALRMSLEGVGLGNDWVSEMEMKRRHFGQHKPHQRTEQVIPDGLFTARYGERAVVIAVELELHIKAMSRYEKLFRQYLKRDSIFLIWYFVPSHSVGCRIVEKWTQAIKKYALSNHHPFLGYTLIDEAMTTPIAMKYYGKANEPIEIGRILKLKPVQKVGEAQATALAHTPAQAVSKRDEAAA